MVRKYIVLLPFFLFFPNAPTIRQVLHCSDIMLMQLICHIEKNDVEDWRQKELARIQMSYAHGSRQVVDSKIDMLHG